MAIKSIFWIVFNSVTKFNIFYVLCGPGYLGTCLTKLSVKIAVSSDFEKSFYSIWSCPWILAFIYLPHQHA